MQNRVLHIMIAEKKFTIPLIEFMLSKAEFKNHKFLVLSNGSTIEFESGNVTIIQTPFRRKLLSNLISYYKCIFRADKILLHTLPLWQLLLFFPNKLKQTSWVINGADLYENIHTKELGFLKKILLRSFGSHITHIEEESNLANRVFNSNANFHYSAMYLSNVVNTRKFKLVDGKQNDFVLLVGNSLSFTNNHVEVLQKLKKHEKQIKRIICPLSYGEDLGYRDEVTHAGKKYFGDKFYPLTNFMPKEDYEKLLESVDLAIFDHWRQEAMGVTLTLMSLGKTVYVRSSTESYKSFVKRGFRLFDNQIVFNDAIKLQDVKDNKALLEKYYCIDSLTKSLLSL